MPWRRALDRVHALAHVEALAADPGAIAAALADAVPAVAATVADHEARDAILRSALEAVDATCVRVMKARLDHALADDTSLAAPTRNLFATTLLKYDGDLPLLAARIRELAARGRAPDPDRIADLVVDAARATLDLRDALVSPILALAAELARASLVFADGAARDRHRSDDERRRWSALRRDLEAIAADPAALAAAPLAARLAAWPAQLDEPEPEREPTLAELIELD
ncbi:MAG: hypothetical protein KF773_10380 [Deltaproteobacteria bacterium]|nr:hypothetical protein [Deltaproteobacteria bacterium]MCW5804693.1 hypothetical protein [Deltaproteobacteria bacterium]